MKNILRTIFVLPWRALSWLRGALANLIMLAIVIFVLLGIFGDGKKPTLPDNAILYVEPGMSIVEQRSYADPFSSIMQTDEEKPAETLLHEMTSAIRWAQHDKNIKGIVIKTDWLAGSDLSKLDSITQAITEFKNSGKPVIAIGDNYSQSQYYLASVADKIYLNPMGSIQLYGFGAYQTYMKDFLDSLSINVHVFRAGQFKSFVEPFVRNDMSPEARENLAQWMDEQWAFYRSAIEQRRKLKPGSIDTFINQQDTLLAENGNNASALALKYGLVDSIASRTEAEKMVNELAGNKNGDEAETVDTDTYYQHILTRQEASKLLDNTSRIAIIKASGQIVEGHQPAGNVGAETLITLIRTAREDEKVSAIVLRIDSPGGSAFASELIRAELAAAQADGKPVVASMGGVAASGGYWIASSADEIWASSTTITGSIGVFGVIPTLEQTLGKYGIHSDGYSTTALADAMQLDRPMNPLAARVIQQGVEFTYGEFLRLVATGRKRTPEAIDLIAQGRVWTGAHAKTLGLVDHIGELDAAIAAAASLAKVEKYEPDYYEPELNTWESLLRDFNANSLLPDSVVQLLKVVSQIPALRNLASLQLFNDPNHVYVQCWECRPVIH
jgi:protease-4